MAILALFWRIIFNEDEGVGMKKIIKYSILTVCIAIFLLIFTAPIINNRIAYSVMCKLKQTPLPQNTILCDSLSMAGKLVGNGNGMQYFGAILIKSDLDLKALENYFTQYRENEWSYIVEQQCEAEVSVLDHVSLRFSTLNNVDKVEKYYIVYSWGESKYPFSDFDSRGH